MPGAALNARRKAKGFSKRRTLRLNANRSLRSLKRRKVDK